MKETEQEHKSKAKINPSSLSNKILFLEIKHSRSFLSIFCDWHFLTVNISIFFLSRSTIFFYPLQGLRNTVKREKQAVEPVKKSAKECNYIWTSDNNISKGVTVLVSYKT